MEAYLKKHLSQLLGRKIVGLCEDDSDKTTDPFPGFVLDDGTAVFVSQDAEGNGPGHFEICRQGPPKPVPYVSIERSNEKAEWTLVVDNNDPDPDLHKRMGFPIVGGNGSVGSALLNLMKDKELT